MRRLRIVPTSSTVQRFAITSATVSSAYRSSFNNNTNKNNKNKLIQKQSFTSTIASSKLVQSSRFCSTSTTTTTTTNQTSSFEEQQQYQFPIITADRLIVIRHLLEGRDPKGVPPTKFDGYFDDPNEIPGSYDVTIRELEELITELFTHDFAIVYSNS